MSDNNNIIIAKLVLTKLAKYYDIPNIEEVVINRFGEVVTKVAGGQWEYHNDPDINYKYMKTILTVLANITHAKFSEDNMPVVSCDIPQKKLRFQGIMGGNVKYDNGDLKGICVAIRSLEAKKMNFDRWGLTPDSDVKKIAQKLQGFDIISDNIEKIQKAIDAQETILVSGPTSVGKTTFTNRLIDMINDHARIITVEDVIELTVPHRNRVRLSVQRNVGTSQFGWNAAVNALMRLTPDWIICGELSVENAATIFNLMGKGHPVMATVHAKTPNEAKDAFVNNMSAAGSNLDPIATKDQLETRIGCIIQLNRDNDHNRRVTDIVFPSEARARRDIIEQAKQERKEKEEIKEILEQEKV